MRKNSVLKSLRMDEHSILVLAEIGDKAGVGLSAVIRTAVRHFITDVTDADGYLLDLHGHEFADGRKQKKVTTPQELTLPIPFDYE